MVTRPLPDREARTRAYGHEIFARLDRGAPTVFSLGWLDDLLMQWSMGDEAVKVQLFRFIDALPNLNDPADVSRHLREYFLEAGNHVPPSLRRSLGLLPGDGVRRPITARGAD